VRRHWGPGLLEAGGFQDLLLLPSNLETKFLDVELAALDLCCLGVIFTGTCTRKFGCA
jgi:hypothetical protein